MKSFCLGICALLMAALPITAQDDIDWNATPNDVNNLLKSMKEMIDVNYSVQVATLSEVAADPAQNPILYRSGHYNFSYSEEQRKRIREYCLAGGMIIYNTGLGSIELIRNRFSGARAPARLPVRVRTQTG